jgi:hypothetical protein
MSAVELVGHFGGAFALADDEGRHLGRPLALTLAAPIGSLGRLLRRREVQLGGEIDAAGLAEGQPVRGEVHLEGAGSLRYRLDFRDDAGRSCRFDGRQRLSLGGTPAALTVLEGRLETAAGLAIGRALLRLDLRSDLWRWCARATMMGGGTGGAR